MNAQYFLKILIFVGLLSFAETANTSMLSMKQPLKNLANSLQNKLYALYQEYIIEPEQQILQTAIDNGNISFVTNSLSKGADVNGRNKNNETPLMEALKNTRTNRLEMVRMLIQKGADVNDQNSQGETPLILAVKSGKNMNKIDIVQELLTAGADIDKRDQDGETAEHYAQDNDTDSPAKREMKQAIRKIFFEHKKMLLESQLPAATAYKQYRQQYKQQAPGLMKEALAKFMAQRPETSAGRFEPAGIIEGYLS